MRVIFHLASHAASFAAQYFCARNSDMLSRLGIARLQGQAVFDASPGPEASTVRPRTKDNLFDEDAARQARADTLVCFLTRALLRDYTLFPLLERARAFFP